ncbi:non-ribosomal peptide synthetase [Xenorhabdus hominickii]|uniref:Amino acid adenylation n=1 Tax=Xenorhabdus hominickii TaxID=351679 RepID=A0A2G0Q161_XENHO|nr:non-ribosomal peptide synthetase [Xenorhabdus hominickii]AOM39961.1 hypothetical protein A9255_04865 [Xenorhabdus hominickii]PHM51994.1 Amino acid adenylation [Xenorhabdus hominickii]PHM52954.1 Amino acid adenylation [Xenorhabdus hominickii]PHM53748.1 Amino acid adenylation [Xenorhabdus hominickii]
MLADSLTENHSSDCCVHEFFERQVLKTPDSVAVRFGEQLLSYRELNRRANRLAHHIHRYHHDGDKISSVGICLERSIDTVVAVIGVLKAGVTYVPIDLSYPTERQAYILNDSNVSVVISRDDIISSLPETITCIDLAHHDFSSRNENDNNDSEAENLSVNCSPQDLAYLIYTSGSTGKPKGVQMPHQALVNLLVWQLQNQGDYSGKRTLQLSPLSFDISFQEIFSTLSCGGELILISNHLRLDQLALISFIAEQRIERIFLPYVALNGLAMAAIAQKCYPENLIDVITAGEQLVITTAIRQFFNILPHCRLHNHYGPSEAHVVTAYTLEGKAENWPVLPTIGSPIHNVEIHLLDANNRAITDNTPGELCIAGRQLAHGYHQRPEETAAKFVYLAVNGNSPTRMYRTGDLARWREDGLLELFGRMDFQVKIRGYRVEPGEVEALLMQHPAVRDAVVLAQGESSEDKRLVSFVIASEQASLHHSQSSIKESIQQFMKIVAPDYMRPAAIVIVDSFPLSASGKLDRKVFPVISIGKLRQQDFAPAKEGAEQVLAEVWRELLGIKTISRNSHFFNLGGHSLLIIKMALALRRRGFTADAHILYQNPVLSELAMQLQVCEPTEKDSDIVEKVLLRDDKSVPSSFDLSKHWGEGAVAEVRRILPENLCNQIRQQSRIHGVTAAALFHLSWAKVIACLTGCNDVVFSTVLLGRRLMCEDVEKAMGQFIKILPLQLHLDSQSVLTCLWNAQGSLMKLVEYEWASLLDQQLESARQSIQASGTTSLFNSLLNYYHSELYNTIPAHPFQAENPVPANEINYAGITERTHYPIYISIDDLAEDFVINVQIAQEMRGIEPVLICDMFLMILQEMVTALEISPEKKIGHIYCSNLAPI